MSAAANLDSQDEDENLLMFKAVVASINFDAVPHLASAVRQERDQQTFKLLDGESNAQLIRCNVSSKPLFGSYNILYPINFIDEVQWVIKIPAAGYCGRWTDSDAGSLTSEALSMRLIKAKTTIPVPEVYSYHSTLEHELNCPFILMEFIEGVSLHEFWFDSSHSQAEIEHRRSRVLSEVASAITQLNRFRFCEGGSIILDQEGNLKIGPTLLDDHEAMLERFGTDDDDGVPLRFEAGPFQKQKDYFHCVLDRRQLRGDKYSRGFNKLLRLFLSWIPYTNSMEKHPFVLGHPDFDIQNFIVSTEGELRGVIDWDGVAAIPSCFANERYPSWLTRDWDPVMYRYRSPTPFEEDDGSHTAEDTNQSDREDKFKEVIIRPKDDQNESAKGDVPDAQDPPENKGNNSTGQGDSNSSSKEPIALQAAAPDVMQENSPAELSRYRDVYQGIIGVLATQAYEKALKDPADNAPELSLPETLMRRTANSLMIDNLLIAANNPMCQDRILEKIFQEIEAIDKDTYDADLEDKEGSGNEGESDASDEAVRLEAVNSSENKVVEATLGTVGGSGNLTDVSRGSEASNDEPPKVTEGEGHQPVEYYDLGTFTFGDIALALADGELDEARFKRLRAGFATFCF